MSNDTNITYSFTVDSSNTEYSVNFSGYNDVVYTIDSTIDFDNPTFEWSADDLGNYVTLSAEDIKDPNQMEFDFLTEEPVIVIRSDDDKKDN